MVTTPRVPTPTTINNNNNKKEFKDMSIDELLTEAMKELQEIKRLLGIINK